MRTKINPETGNTLIVDSIIKHKNTMKQINIETGNTIATDVAIKSANTMKQINPNTGKSIYDENSEKTSGINHYSFKGYYIVNDDKFSSVLSLCKFINYSVTCHYWCKNNNKKPSKRNYKHCKYLQSLGSVDYILSHTFKELGFSFEYI